MATISWAYKSGAEALALYTAPIAGALQDTAPAGMPTSVLTKSLTNKDI